MLLPVLVAEVVTGIVTGSLALLSDAGHMLMDVGGIGLAIGAIQVASRAAPRAHRTFGLYRLEILAALANTLLLFGIAAYVLIEAVQRFGDAPDIPAGPLLTVAVCGLAANIVAFVLLRAGAKESINVEAAYVEVLADTLGSLGVITAAIVLAITGWTWVDPVIGVAIALWILPRGWRLGAQALRILVQAAPRGLDLDAVQADLGVIAGVLDVHDLHAWTLTSEMDVVSAHVRLDGSADSHAVLDQAREILTSRYGIRHATLQIEPADHRGCEEVTW